MRRYLGTTAIIETYEMLYLQNWNWELNINEETYTNVPTQRKITRKGIKVGGKNLKTREKMSVQCKNVTENAPMK